MLIGIIGYGEIGQSLEKCYLGKDFSIGILDTYNKIDTMPDKVDVLNICIPYSDDFVDIVSKYVEQYKPQLTVIHSTVIPGTTHNISKKTNINNIVHSPVRGVHPNLYQGLKTFVKFIGADTSEIGYLTKIHFEDIGIKSKVISSTRSTELAKILSTTYYGLCIAFHNDIDKLCKQLDVSYKDVATSWNETYNEGYEKLGMKNVIRPVLYPPKDGKIGGHCVIPNVELLSTFFDSKIIDYILELK